ncbi:MAG: hypothetical protein II336_05635 [Loktanella sp.]|nr:hypothetical protein [Loktanella sp.]
MNIFTNHQIKLQEFDTQIAEAKSEMVTIYNDIAKKEQYIRDRQADIRTLEKSVRSLKCQRGWEVDRERYHLT